MIQQGKNECFDDEIVVWGNTDANIMQGGSLIVQKPPLYKIRDVHLLGRVSKVVSTAQSVCLLSSTGSLFSWGRDPDCGHGTNDLIATPQRIETLSSYCIVDVSAGRQHITCCSSQGDIFTWGSGNNSLGHGIGINLLPIPSRIESLHGTEIANVACMDNNSFAVTKDGQLYAWGETGPFLGNSTTVACPIPVHNTCIRQEVIAVYAGYSHAGVCRVFEIKAAQVFFLKVLI